MKERTVLKMQPIDHLSEMNNLLSVLLSIPAVKQFVDTHSLINQQVFRNECYEIVTNDNETLVYINPDFLKVPIAFSDNQ